MTVYPYIVVFRFTHKTTGKTEEHTVSTEAYSLNEAMMQALFELDSVHDFIANGYEGKVLTVGPDTAKFKERTETFVSDLITSFSAPRKK